ncbi:MAG: SIS domain-containing protein [Bacteroidota bacterium]|nr:SIS domain-containing protein [Bacteroidota bacterium]
MPLNLYKTKFQEFLNSETINKQIFESIKLVKDCKRIFFIGNGGSNAICSHMMEDYAKIAGYPTFAFSDAALITCFANDYGFENAMVEWLKIHFTEGDLLVAISSSGNSPNINNSVDFVNSKKGKVITLSGFENNNKLVNKGNINFWLDAKSYGIVECYHQTILHIILDELHANK